MGGCSTLRNNHAMLIGDQAYFCFAGPMVKYWDAGKSPDNYLRVAIIGTLYGAFSPSSF